METAKMDSTSRQAQLHMHQLYGWLHVSAFSKKLPSGD
jgi:hypothetical protein